MASSAVSTNGDTAPGTNVMVVGICFQMAALTAFVLCGMDFLRRNLRHPTTLHGMWVIIAATVFSVFFIFVRSIYRTIELLEGWTGYLIMHEWYFIGLDGIPMILAVGVYNLIHPGWWMPLSANGKGIDAHETFRSMDSEGGESRIALRSIGSRG